MGFLIHIAGAVSAYVGQRVVQILGSGSQFGRHKQEFVDHPGILSAQMMDQFGGAPERAQSVVQVVDHFLVLVWSGYYLHRVAPAIIAFAKCVLSRSVEVEPVFHICRILHIIDASSVDIVFQLFGNF